MKPYLNKADREAFVCMAGIHGFANVLLRNPEGFRNGRKVKRSLAAIMNHSEKVMNAMDEGLDDDAKVAIFRAAATSKLSVIPQHSPLIGDDTYLITKKDLAIILQGASQDCMWCDKEGREMRRCQLRKALIRSGLLGCQKHEDCPFRGLEGGILDYEG